MKKIEKHVKSEKFVGPSVNLQDLTGYLLRCASNIADASFFNTANSAEITPRQFAVLLTLKNYGPQTQRQLSSRTHIDNSTISEMVPRMIRRGLMISTRSKLDKRAWELRLSELGEQRLNTLTPLTVASQDKVLDLLPREYRRIFIHCLQVILEAKEDSFLKENDGEINLRRAPTK